MAQRLASVRQEVSGGVAVGPAEAEAKAGFSAGLGARGEFGPGTPARWALIFFVGALFYILLVTYSQSR